MDIIKSSVIILLVLFSIMALVNAIRLFQESRTATSFFLLNGKLKALHFINTMVMSDLSFRIMLISVTIGYVFGMKGVFFGIISIATTISGYWVFKGRFKEFIEDSDNGGSLPEFICSLFVDGNKEKIKYLRFSVSLASILILVVSIIFELHIADIIFSKIYGVENGIVIFPLLGLITLYAVLGGYKSIIVTDMIQACTLLLAIGAFVYFMVQYTPEHTVELKPYVVETTSNSTGFLRLMSSFFVGFIWLLTTTESWQRFSATRNFTLSNKGVLWSGLIKVVWVVLFTIFGVYIKDVIEPALMYYHIELANVDLVPYFFEIGNYVSQTGLKIALSIIFVGVLMCAISTVDTYLIAIGHTYTSDVVLNKSSKKMGNLNSYENRHYSYVGKLAIVGISFAIMLSWYVLKKTMILDNSVLFFFVASSLQFIIFPLLLIGLFMKKVNVHALIILVVSGIATTFFSWFYILNMDDDSVLLSYMTLSDIIKCLPLFVFLVTSLSFLMGNYVPMIYKWAFKE